MGILSLFSQSFQVIFEYKTIFSQITLTLITPLVLAFLSNLVISDGVFHFSEENPYRMLFQAYVLNNSPDYYFDVEEPNFIPWFFFFLAGFLQIAFYHILSTATIVYTIFSLYFEYDNVTFTHSVQAVRPKIMGRLTITYLTILIVYTVMIKYLYLILHDTFSPSVFFVSCILGFLYLSILWQLACVITVVENSCYGPRSILKAIRIVKGNTRVAFVISLALYVYIGGLVFVFMALVMHNNEASVMWRLVMATICGGFLLFGFLFNTVIYTLLYYVCKLYHQEHLDDPVRLSGSLTLNQSLSVSDTMKILVIVVFTMVYYVWLL